MANIVSNMISQAGDWLAAKVAPYLNDAMGKREVILASYYQGDHRPQLKIKPGQQFDDNISQNFVGLAVDRSVSRLFKGGVTFNLPKGATDQDEYLKKVWDLNKKEIILYQVGLHGAVYGTPYFKICPDELIDPYTGELYPRLIPLDPEITRVFTDPQDMNEVDHYKIEYQIARKNAGGAIENIGYREITRRNKVDEVYDLENGAALSGDFWIIEEWERSSQYSNIWTLVKTSPWDYDFPPIIHWKNLPSLKSCYGDSDIDDAIAIQDKSNFVVSNTGKIIRFHAHPQTIGTGFDVKDMQSLEGGVNTFHSISNADAKVFNLEMQSDLASSVAFGQNLRQSIFDVAREIDISSMADKLGQLTNFGLQVLWSDALDKNDTKRQLYGDAILELNRRLLVLKGHEKEASNPGALAWGNPLPVNIKEELEADQIALELHIVDLETLTKKYHYRYGQNYETIQANIAKQSAMDNANNGNVGAQILRNFGQGQQ